MTSSSMITSSQIVTKLDIVAFEETIEEEPMEVEEEQPAAPQGLMARV